MFDIKHVSLVNSGRTLHEATGLISLPNQCWAKRSIRL